MFKLMKSRLLESDLRMEPRYGSEYCRIIVYTAYQDDEKKQVRSHTHVGTDVTCITYHTLP